MKKAWQKTIESLHFTSFYYKRFRIKTSLGKQMQLAVVREDILDWFDFRLLQCVSASAHLKKKETIIWRWEEDFIWDSPGEGHWTGCQETSLLFPALLFTFLTSRKFLWYKDSCYVSVQFSVLLGSRIIWQYHKLIDFYFNLTLTLLGPIPSSFCCNYFQLSN